MGTPFDPKKDAGNVRKHGVSLPGERRVVVHALRGDDARIISVRRPEPKEVRAYEKGI